MTPDELKREIAGRISHEDLASFSGLSYGAAGACLAIVLLLAQIWTTPPKALHLWAIAFGAVAMPLFVGVAVFDQFWHSFKLPYIALQRIPRVNYLRAAAWYTADACLLASVDCVLFSLSRLVGGIFLSLALLMIIGVYVAWRYAGGRALVSELRRAHSNLPP